LPPVQGFSLARNLTQRINEYQRAPALVIITDEYFCKFFSTEFVNLSIGKNRLQQLGPGWRYNGNYFQSTTPLSTMKSFAIARGARVYGAIQVAKIV